MWNLFKFIIKGFGVYDTVYIGNGHKCYVGDALRDLVSFVQF